MEIKEMIAVLQAFEEGKEIEEVNGKFITTIGNIRFRDFDFLNRTYRIKPQSTYIPFTWEDRESFRGKWIRFKGGKNEHMINFIDSDGSVLCASWEHRVSLSSLFESHEFTDGTPFGKLA